MFIFLSSFRVNMGEREKECVRVPYGRSDSGGHLLTIKHSLLHKILVKNIAYPFVSKAI